MYLFFSVVNTIHRNPRDGLSLISMANTSSHHMSSLNSAHLPDGGSYFVTGMKIYHLMIVYFTID
jgi:hypothetical protein